MAFAPHGWKAILPLRYLGITHDVVYVTLSELRTVLPKKFNVDKVTLPTLVVDDEEEGSRVIMHSYEIARYLEAHFSTTERSIFRGEPGQYFSRFIEQWVDRSLAIGIRPCVLHTSYAQFPIDGPHADLASNAAFLAKCGQAKMDEVTSHNSDPQWTQLRYQEVRKELGTIETLLAERVERGTDGRFLGGNQPLHADYCVYAFYAYSRTNRELVEKTWHHESLPSIQRWLSAFQEIELIDEAELSRLPTRL